MLTFVSGRNVVQSGALGAWSVGLPLGPPSLNGSASGASSVSGPL